MDFKLICFTSKFLKSILLYFCVFGHKIVITSAGLVLKMDYEIRETLGCFLDPELTIYYLL